MLKQEKINIEDTNMALFGSPIEKEIKKLAAQGEPAWKTAGKTPGMEIWRIEKFQVKPWPKEQYGKFYDGDSYIVLRTYKREDALAWDVHFWLGEHTTLDEAGTAAYKTVELDDFLNGTPVQYREVQGFESEKFLALFPKIEILSGGVETGFRHVAAAEYKPRLLHIKGTVKHVVVRQVPITAHSLNRGDSFILDMGLKVYQFNGQKAGVAEKSKATQLARALDDERGSKVEILVIGEADHDDDAQSFWSHLGGKSEIKEADGDDHHVGKVEKKMFRVHHEGDKTDFTEVKFAKSSLASDDVFVCDCIHSIFIWCGRGANPTERKEGFTFAQSYLNKKHKEDNRPATLPIVRVMEGGENEEFLANF
jgi:gelsolin